MKKPHHSRMRNSVPSPLRAISPPGAFMPSRVGKPATLARLSTSKASSIGTPGRGVWMRSFMVVLRKGHGHLISK
jgi:hypothetical protein